MAALCSCGSNAPHETRSLEGAKQAFYPDRYEYTVGDLLLSLPIGYYETAPNRLTFAQTILLGGSPKPVLEQEKYLVLEADALAPRRHFVLLDQRHLLVYSELFELEEGWTPRLEVLQRKGDAAWSNITKQAVPDWARSPMQLAFSDDYRRITVTDSSGRARTLVWKSGALELKD